MQKYNELKGLYSTLKIANANEAEILNIKMENLTKKWNQIFFSNNDDVIKKNETEKIQHTRPTQLDVQSFKIETSDLNSNNVFKVISPVKNKLKTPELNKSQSVLLVETSILKTPTNTELDNFIEVSQSSKTFSTTMHAVDQVIRTNDSITLKIQLNEVQNNDIQVASEKILLKTSDINFNMAVEPAVNSNIVDINSRLEEEHKVISNSESNPQLLHDESLFQPEQIDVKLNIETHKMAANDLFDWLLWINHTLESQVRYN